VVEDADESLQTVSSDNPAQRPLDAVPMTQGQGGMADYDSSGSSRNSGSGSAGGSHRGSRRGGPAGTAGGGGLHGQADASPTPAPIDHVAEKRAAQERSDNLISLAGLSLLVALVVLAALYSRRAGSDD
jgi:hypothetical protein